MMNTIQTSNITSVATVNAPISHVWNLLTAPTHITNWVTPSTEYKASSVVNNFAIGGSFNFPLSPVNNFIPFGFDFTGTYTNIIPNSRFSYTLDNGYVVRYEFNVLGESVEIIQTVDYGTEKPNEFILNYFNTLLNNFKTYLNSYSTPSFTGTTSVFTPISHVWNLLTTPAHIKNWVAPTTEFTSSPVIENFVIGGEFSFPFTPVNHNNSFELNFVGTFTNIIPTTLISYTLENGTTFTLSLNVVGESVELFYTVDFGTHSSTDFTLAYFDKMIENFRNYVTATYTSNN